MTAENWDGIGSLFDEAVRRRGGERREFLARVGREDAALERELQSLLTAHERRGRFDALGDLVSGPQVRRLFRFDPGDPVGPYRVVRAIGRGGMATVYLAHDPKHDRSVAIKVLRPSLAATLGVQRFLREIEIASRLTHPHILPVFDSGEVDGVLYFVMPYVDGETLRERLERESRLSVEDMIRLTGQISSALTYAHERGIVHRDIKPSNILLTGDQAVVADFGIARAVAAASEERWTRTGLGIGTPDYMSPEQALGIADIDARSDVYALGCVVYEMACGRTPFEGRTLGERLANIATPPPRLRTTDPDTPLFLDRAVQRALAGHPDDRFQTPSELAAALTAGTVAARLGRRQRRRWLQRGAGAAALVAAASLLPLMLSGSDADRIAVLPLTNLTNEEEYLVEGVHEALISELAQLDIPVVPRASVASYAGSTLGIRDIARELDVDKVIEGSIYRQGDSLWVNARLYDGDTEEEVWSGSYDGDLPNVPDDYRAFARAIATDIDSTVGPDDEERFRRSLTIDPEVYEAYLRGMDRMNQSTEEALSRALYFERAVERNPADPLAYAGLAFAYITLAHGPAPPPDALHLARAAAERSVRLDSTLAEGWAALADIRTYLTWDWEGAEDAFNRTNELNPSMAMNHYHRAWYLALFGRAEEAIAAHERAREIDPLTPLHTVWLPGLYFWLGRIERALTEARIVAEQYPDNATALYVLGQAAAELGEYDEAIAAHEKAAAINPQLNGALGRTYAVAGRTDDALAILAELEAAPPTSWGAYMLAELHTALGNFDEAFRWLAFEPAHNWLPWTTVAPTFAPLRDDPRFEQLIRRLKLLDQAPT